MCGWYRRKRGQEKSWGEWIVWCHISLGYDIKERECFFSCDTWKCCNNEFQLKYDLKHNNEKEC